MISYQLINGGDAILRVTDGAYIPTDFANVDYQTYLAWLAVGNTPDPAPNPAPAPATKISAAAFLARFTSAEELAVQAAAQANPSIALGLTVGLAKGAINLVGDAVVTNWMQAIVSAGAITQARMTEIMTP